MTTEQEAAFLKLGALGDDELFLAGWKAALAHRPAAVEMNSVEIENKFNNWRGNPRNVEYLCQFEAARDAWFAAWEAHSDVTAERRTGERAPVKVSDLPITDMTREEEFEKWWAHSSAKLHCSENTAQWIWNSAWCTAKLGQWEATKAEALSEVKAFLRAEASSAFLAGLDEEARLLRLLAIRIEKFDK